MAPTLLSGASQRVARRPLSPVLAAVRRVVVDLQAARPQGFGDHPLADRGEVGGRLGLTLDIDPHLNVSRLAHAYDWLAAKTETLRDGEDDLGTEPGGVIANHLALDAFALTESNHAFVLQIQCSPASEATTYRSRVGQPRSAAWPRIVQRRRIGLPLASSWMLVRW
jgi:hypothetical protein